jgi:hypothetical protein
MHLLTSHTKPSYKYPSINHITLASPITTTITSILQPHPIYRCKVPVHLYPSDNAPGFVVTDMQTSSQRRYAELPSHKLCGRPADRRFKN